MCICVYIHKEHIMVPVGEKKMFGVFFWSFNKPNEHNLKTLSKYAFKKCSDKISHKVLEHVPCSRCVFATYDNAHYD